MSPFAYVARDSDGREQSGVAGSASEAALVDDLRRRGWLILDIQPARDVAAVGTNGHGAAALGHAAHDDAARARRRGPVRGLAPPQRDVETGLRQVALLIRSGLTLLVALRTAAEHARRASMGRRWDAVADRIESGSSLVDALQPFPRQFPPLVREMVRAGEQSGTLDRTLDRAAGLLEKRRELRATVLHALFYPAIVLTLTVAVASFMVLKVIPVLETFLLGSHRKLPALTEALLWVSTAARTNLPVLLVVAASLVILAVLLDRWPSTRPGMDAAIYRVPIVGHLRRLSNTVLFSRSLSVLLASGVGIVTALELVQGILARPVTADAIGAARRRILSGRSLSEGLAGSPGFSPLLVKMVAVGERGGQLDAMLEDAAGFHEADLRAWIQRATAWIEPVLTLSVGAIVGFVYVAFFLALFSMAGGG